jgi:hypothetical protein
MSITVTTPEICTETDGMEDDTLIPDDFLDIPNDDSVNPSDLRPGAEPLISDVDNLEIVIHLTDEPEGVKVGEIDIPTDDTNIVEVLVQYKPSDTEDYVVLGTVSISYTILLDVTYLSKYILLIIPSSNEVAGGI